MSAPLSVIIPCLNAENDLPFCLSSLKRGRVSGLVREIIVVDGGSDDRSRDIADRAGACVFVSDRPGRGVQLRYGAGQARGRWLLFLHADTALSVDWGQCARAHIDNHPGMAAVFTLAWRSQDAMAAIVARRANWRARVLGLPYGDQGLLVSRPLYDAVGGYRDVPLLEDVEIVRAIGRRRLTILSALAQTSAAKYERDGWRRRSWRNTVTIVRYLLGASPEKLAKTCS